MLLIARTMFANIIAFFCLLPPWFSIVCVCVSDCVCDCVLFLFVWNKALAQIISKREFKIWTILYGNASRVPTFVCAYVCVCVLGYIYSGTGEEDQQHPLRPLSPSI